MLCVNFVAAQISTHYGAEKFAPVDGKKILIIGQDLGAVGGLPNYTDGYIDNVLSHKPAGVTSYTDIPNLGGLKNLDNWGAGDVHANAYINAESFDNSIISLGIYLVDRLDGIVSGSMDSGITEFARWVKEQNRPIFIRLGYDFEGPWNGYDPTKFKNAWRHVVQIFDQENVLNAAFVWQSAGLNYNNIENWYPGDEFVNWMGFSQFDGPNPGQSILNFAKERNKPVMIAEATPRVDLKIGDGQMHWDNWYQKLFNKIYDEDIIKALAYINVNWDIQPLWNGQGWGDSRVQANDLVLENWEIEIAKEPWITSTETLFYDLNYDIWVSPSSTTTEHLDNIDVLVNYHSRVISIKTHNSNKIKFVNIYDINGTLISHDQVDSESALVNYNLSVENSIVFLQCITDHDVFTKKMFLKN